MYISNKPLLWRLALSCASSQLAWLAPANAQEMPRASVDAPKAGSPSGLDAGDIIVTARRVSESVQRVPVSVSVVSQDTLARANIYDASNLLREIPGVQGSTKIPGGALTTGFTRVRGVAGLATFFGDAPYPAQQWTLYAPFFDIENVQVLKGPQGTLFGQASNAGVEIVTPRKPGNDFGGYVRADAGNYKFKNIEGAVDIPIIADSVLLRLSGKSFYRSGWVKDVISNRFIGREEFDIGRLSLVIKPVDFIENHTVYQHERVRDTGNVPGVINDYNFSPTPANPAQVSAQAAANGMTLAQWNAARDQVLAQQIALGSYKYQGWSIGCPASSISPGTKSTVPGPNVNGVVPQACAPGGGEFISNGLFNTTLINISDDIVIKNIVSHLWGHWRQGLFEADYSRLILNDANPRTLASVQNLPMTWSEELQLSGNVGRSLKFVLGGFGYTEKVKPRGPLFGLFSTSLADTATLNRTKTKSRALYGQITYDMTAVLQGLSLTGGLRQSWDTAYRQQFVLNPTTLQIVAQNGGPGTASGEAHFKALSYTAGVQYQASAETMIYLTNAKGYSAGGLQNVPGIERFEPDSLNNLEIGLKTGGSIGNFKLRANVAGYYGWYDNVQVRTLAVVTIPGTTSQTFVNGTQNAASARIRGFEGELNGTYAGLFSIRAFVGHALAKYTKFLFVNPTTGQQLNLTGSPFINSPKWKFGISPTVYVPVDPAIGDISLSANFTYNSGWWSTLGKPITPTNPANPDTGAICKVKRTAANGYGPLSADGRTAYKDCVPSNYNLNMTMDWRNLLGTTGLSASVTVTNVTRKAGYVSASSTYDTLNFNFRTPNMPRMIYGSLSYAF